MKQVYPAGLLFTLFVLFSATLSAQVITIDQGGTVSGCGGVFTDSGGRSGNHAPSGTRQVITLCADGSSQGTHIQLQFTEIAFRGTLTVFNGPSTAADTLRQITRADVGDQLSLAATSENSSGCLTVEFVSTGEGAGWSADINCIIACQPIVAELASSIPSAVPLRDGYIDVCVGEPITLTGRGRYPQNNSIYPQSDATAQFSWTFQTGDGAQGKSVTYTYDEPGAYMAELFITDDRGCTNTNRINQRIRVAPPPRFAPDRKEDPKVCAGEAITLTAGTDKQGEHAYRPAPQTIEFSATQTFSEQISIPDRQDEVYSSGLDIQLFSPGQQIQSGRDIAEICITIEHSYLADLNMWIECPDGTQVNLLSAEDFVTTSVNHRFGYGDVDNTGPEPAETYCFTADAAQTIFDYIQGAGSGGRTPPILPFDRTYLPKDLNFAGFVGCEMNGEWRLYVQDTSPEDDGTIYSWEVRFSDELVFDDESFTVPITSTRWVDDGQYAFYAPDSVVLRPDHPGFSHQRLSLTDSFGCSYDTLVRVAVTSPLSEACFSCRPHPALPPVDTQVCAGQSLVTDLRGAFSLDTLIRWEAGERRHITVSDTSYLQVADQLPSHFPTAVGGILQGVCIDLTADLSLTETEVALVAPGGQRIVVVPRGSVTARQIQRCYTAAELNGLPSLAGQPINGQWALMINDASGRLDGRLNGWSVDLTDRPPLTYRWITGQDDLSCTDCPRPIITPAGSQTYTLEATTPRGCSQTIDYRVAMMTADVDFTPTIQDGCVGIADGSVTLQPLTDTPIATYTWNNGATTRDITGLMAGTYQLTVVTENGCQQSFTYQVAPPTDLTLRVDTTTAVTCFGESDGYVRVAASGGYGDYSYTWSEGISSTTNNAARLAAGVYGATVTDAGGCKTSTTVTVLSPDELALNLAVTDVRCRGGNDGTIEALPVGGTLPYTYRWNNNTTEHTLTDRTSGTYSVTVTDANGCQVSGKDTVRQPEIPLSVRVINEVAGCHGTQTNEATALARGGNGDYRYTWSNGETGALAFSLPAGENWVEVSDRSGCVYRHTFLTESRPPIEPEIIRASGDECRPVYDRTLEVRAAGNYFNYRWSNGANGVRITDLTGETTYSVTLTDAEGCTGTTSTTTEPHIPWRLDLEVTPVSCFGERNGALEIHAATNRHGSQFVYEWGANTGYAVGPSLLNRPAGRYALTMTDAIGCTFDTLITVPGPPVMAVGEKVEPVSCFGADNGSISVQVEGGNGEFTYAWSTGDRTPTLTELAPGNYQLTVSDAKGCGETREYELKAPVEITLDINSQGPVCGGEYNGRIDVVATGGEAPFEFSLDDERYGEAPTFPGLGGGAYTVYVRDRYGCTVSQDLEIEDGPPFSVDLGDDREIIYGDSLALVANVVGGRGVLDYAWSGTAEGTLDCTDCPEPIARPAYEIDYQLSVMDEMGCMAEDKVRIRVRKIREVAVPTAFTPNGDGYNDRLLVHGRPGTRVIQLSIFDRWGNWLYSAGEFTVNDKDTGWDGRDNRGKELDAGVYIFKIEVEYEDGSRETVSGQTTLIK